MKKSKFVFDSSKIGCMINDSIKPENYEPVSFVLMATVLPVHAVTGVIDFPTTIEGRKNRATEISSACAVSTWVTIAPAVITAVNLTITNYSSAATGNRPAKFRLMNNAIKNKLLVPFQEAADNDPGNSIAILESGKFKAKLQYIPQIHVFEAKNGIEDGSVDLEAPGGPSSPHLHEWMSSQDGIIWKKERSTNSAKTHLTGFRSGEYAWFTHELSVKDVPQGVSEPIRIRVN